MKALVVYYSRTGVTRKVGQAIAQVLSADLEELIDTKNRKGPIGFVVAGKDAATKQLVPIEPPQKNPADYDLVVVGTPVWAGTMSTAVRTYLSDRGKDIQKAAVFCTTHSSGIDKTLAEMAELIGGQTVAKRRSRRWGSARNTSRRTSTRRI
jgi:flavodoxin